MNLVREGDIWSHNSKSRFSKETWARTNHKKFIAFTYYATANEKVMLIVLPK